MLTVDDFQLVRAVCELRFNEAYLIYDRAGSIFQLLRRKYPTMSVDQAAPNAIQMSTDDATFVLETSQCRVIADRNLAKPESLSELCDIFFSMTADLLEIDLFTRIGLRTIYIKYAQSIETSVGELNSLKLSEMAGRTMRFGASEQIRELMLKWEGNELGATFQLIAETAKILKTKLPPEIESARHDKFGNRESHYLKMDIDYFTTVPVERSQLDVASWIPQSLRHTKKESDKLLALL